MIAHSIFTLELCPLTLGQCGLKSVEDSGLLNTGTEVQVWLHAAYYLMSAAPMHTDSWLSAVLSLQACREL